MAEAKIKNLYQKLLEVRRAVPYLQQVKEGHKFKYVGSSQVIGAVREKLDDLNVFLMVNILDKRTFARERPDSGKVTYEIEFDLEYTWVNGDDPNEKIVINWFGMGLEIGDNSKAMGKALTYAEKYFFLKEFNIATDKDDPDAHQQQTESSVKETIEDEDVQKVNDLIAEFAELKGQSKAMVMTALQIRQVNRLTKPEALNAIQVLIKWIENAKGKAEKQNQAG